MYITILSRLCEQIRDFSGASHSRQITILSFFTLHGKLISPHNGTAILETKILTPEKVTGPDGKTAMVPDRKYSKLSKLLQEWGK